MHYRLTGDGSRHREAAVASSRLAEVAPHTRQKPGRGPQNIPTKSPRSGRGNDWQARDLRQLAAPASGTAFTTDTLANACSTLVELTEELLSLHAAETCAPRSFCQGVAGGKWVLHQPAWVKVSRFSRHESKAKD